MPTYLFKAAPQGIARDIKINAIKALRMLTGIHLKDAKDAVEGMMEGRSYEFPLRPDTEHNGEFLEGQRICKEFFTLILTSEDSKSPLAAATTTCLTSLKKLIHETVDTNHVDMAIDLLTIYKKHAGL